MDVSDDFEDEGMSSVSRCSTPLNTPTSGSGYGDQWQLKVSITT